MLTKLKKTFDAERKCIRCPQYLEEDATTWTKYCPNCRTKRRRENQELGAQVKKLKRQTRFIIVRDAIYSGKRLTIKEIEKISGYKEGTIITMMQKFKDIKAEYMYYKKVK